MIELADTRGTIYQRLAPKRSDEQAAQINVRHAAQRERATVAHERGHVGGGALKTREQFGHGVEFVRAPVCLL